MLYAMKQPVTNAVLCSPRPPPTLLHWCCRAFSNCAVYNGQGIMLGGRNDTFVFDDVWSLEPEHLAWRMVRGGDLRVCV